MSAALQRKRSSIRLYSAALLLGALSVAFYELEMLRLIPGLRCESFGCIGVGLIYATLAALLPVVFAVGTALFTRQQRSRQFFHALVAGYFSMALAALTINMLAEQRIARGYQAHDRACAQYPQLCPPVPVTIQAGTPGSTPAPVPSP